MPRNLAVSGISYWSDATTPEGSRVREISVNGSPLADNATYTVALVEYLAAGGDGYTVSMNGTNPINGPVDVDALVAYMESLPRPVTPPVSGRITKARSGT